MVIEKSVKDFGAKGNGRTDDVLAFQKAEDYLFSKGGGTLYVPESIYPVSKPFYHRSFVTLAGDGDKSIIRNTSTVAGPGQFCIYIGNFAPLTFAQCPHFNLYPIVAGTNRVQLKTPADIQNFAVGKAVLIDSLSGFMSADGHWKPYAAFINRITDISGDIITLEDNVSIDIPVAQIASTDQMGKSYICQEPVIRDIRFESLGDWTLRFGVYKGIFDNISLKTTDVIGGNGFSYCLFKNIRAEFSQKVIEMAMYSHNTAVDGLVATWYDGAVDTDIKPLIKMGENMRDCTFNNLDIDSGDGKYFGEVIRFEHAFNNKIINSNFKCPSVTQNGIEIKTADEKSFVQNNEVSGNTLMLGNTDSYIRLENDTDVLNMSGNKIIKNTYSGSVRKDKIIRIGAVENNVVEV